MPPPLRPQDFFSQDLCQAFINLLQSKVTSHACLAGIDPRHCRIIPRNPKPSCGLAGTNHTEARFVDTSDVIPVLGCDAIVAACPHDASTGHPHPISRACFNPSAKAAEFLTWLFFKQQRHVDHASHSLFLPQLLSGYYAAEVDETYSLPQIREHMCILINLVSELQEPSNEDPWPAPERIHGVLNWMAYPEEQCLLTLVKGMIACKRERFEKWRQLYLQEYKHYLRLQEAICVQAKLVLDLQAIYPPL